MSCPKRQGQLSSWPSVYLGPYRLGPCNFAYLSLYIPATEKHFRLSPRTRAFRQKASQFGRSSDNRRFCSPNYSAWRRSRTESLLSNARLLLFVLPLAPASLARSAHLAPLTSLAPAGGWRTWYCAGVGGYELTPCELPLMKRARAYPASSEALLLILTQLMSRVGWDTENIYRRERQAP